MSANLVERNAQKLNNILREFGCALDKAWRTRVRTLLMQTYTAMNARPIDGALCRQLSDQIDAELAAIKPKIDAWTDPDNPCPPKTAVKKSSKLKSSHKIVYPPSNPINCQQPITPGDPVQTPEKHSDIAPAFNHKTIDSTADPESCADSLAQKYTANEIPAKQTTLSDNSIGLFDLIHVEIRCFFKIRACIRPPYIGKFVDFAEHFADVRETRIEAFINVLSKRTEFGFKSDVEVGYEDDLLPNMPDLNLVLHPRRKKR